MGLVLGREGWFFYDAPHQLCLIFAFGSGIIRIGWLLGFIADHCVSYLSPPPSSFGVDLTRLPRVAFFLSEVKNID